MEMEMRPALSFSSRLSLREFETEMWKLYFGVVKGLLLAITSVIPGLPAKSQKAANFPTKLRNP